MIVRLIRFLVLLTLGGATVYTAVRVAGQRRDEQRLDNPVRAWPDVPLPARAAPAWVEPVDGACPDSHPVKVKLRSSLYHLPGMLAYQRTHPDRCYATAEAAEADGFTRARR